MKKQNNDDLGKLQGAAVKELLGYFDGPRAVRESKTAMINARLAIGALSTVARLRATERARDAMQLMVIKAVSEDKKQFAKYIRISMPELHPPKLLGKPE